MKTIFLILVLITGLISFEVEIQDILKNGNAKIEIQDKLQIGNSGIVIKNLKDGFKVITAYAELIAIDEVHFYPFVTLKQDNLPHGLWKPENGDIVRFQENYNRAVILAKSFNSFIQISKRFNQEWIHSDIFTATLSSIGHKTPLKEDFQYFCQEHSIGLIYIELKDEIKKVDCLSLKTLETIPMKFENLSFQKPFYSRIKKIDSNIFGDGIDDIQDFDKYYRGLIR